MPYLLDSSALIALAEQEHPSHKKAQKWLLEAADVLVCPIAEGALFRHAMYMGAKIDFALNVIRTIRSHPKFSLIADDLHYDEADWSGLQGYRQVTDFYLVELARRHGATLVTLDSRLSAARPDATFLIQ